MLRRPKHPRAELERIMREQEVLGWQFTRQRSGYYKGRCPCADRRHIKMVHLTPSGSRYALNLRKWFERCQCPVKGLGGGSET